MNLLDNLELDIYNTATEKLASMEKDAGPLGMIVGQLLKTPKYMSGKLRPPSNFAEGIQQLIDNEANMDLGRGLPGLRFLKGLQQQKNLGLTSFSNDGDQTYRRLHRRRLFGMPDATAEDFLSPDSEASKKLRSLIDWYNK